MEKEDSCLILIKYSDSSYVLRGNTKKYKSELISMGCKWNPNLTGGAGWIISRSIYNTINEWLNALEREKEEEREEEKNTFPSSKEILKRIENIESELKELKRLLK